MLKYMRIPSTAGTRDPERSRFFIGSERRATISVTSQRRVIGADPATPRIGTRPASSKRSRSAWHMSSGRDHCPAVRAPPRVREAIKALPHASKGGLTYRPGPDRAPAQPLRHGHSQAREGKRWTS